MSIFKLAFYCLYLLQLENYNIPRFWKIIIDKARSKAFSISQRQKIVWTKKAVLVLLIGIILALIGSLSLAYFYPEPWSAIILVVAFLIYFNLLAPFFFTIAVWLITPFDSVAKKAIISQAKSKIAGFKNLKIIGITGSYGKTTMKECLASVLSEKFKVLSTPENINTPVGISRLILDKLTSDTEIFVVEMGAYQRGDIKSLCEITRPDIAVLTGINQAHLERFGSIENTIAAKFEIVSSSKINALVVLNEENKLVKDNYQKFLGSRKMFFYNNSKQDISEINIPLLGTFVPSIINGCVIIGKELGMGESDILSGIQKIKQIPHRLQLINPTNGVTVIDDSYNGNPDGGREAIKVLGTFNDKRKIYLTPGLVEMGEDSKSIHLKIGQQLAKVADLVILVKNSVTPFIAEGLKIESYLPEKIMWFDSALSAHEKLKEILKPGDVILFQNDWPDNYV
jgi:UDP-N-acetylmuramoyl-tripeptide--D-alanyl-D-alanine ligase